MNNSVGFRVPKLDEKKTNENSDLRPKTREKIRRIKKRRNKSLVAAGSLSNLQENYYESCVCSVRQAGAGNIVNWQRACSTGLLHAAGQRLAE